MSARISRQMPLPPARPRLTPGQWRRYAQRLERELLLAKSTSAALRARLAELEKGARGGR